MHVYLEVSPTLLNGVYIQKAVPRIDALMCVLVHNSPLWTSMVNTYPEVARSRMSLEF